MAAASASPPECCENFALSRRSLLRSAGAASLGGAAVSILGGAVIETVYGAESPEANVVVLVSLRGGVDGLSLVVPHAESAYYAARPATSIAASRLLHADSTFGLHPSFAPLSGMWSAGSMTAIQAVGLPAPNRSHFDAMVAVEDADPGSSERTGWLNRLIGGLGSSSPFEAMHLSGSILPTALVGPESTLAASDLTRLDVPHAGEPAVRSAVRAALGRLSAGSDVVSRAARGALGVADDANAAAALVGARNGANYTSSSLSKGLQQAAGAVRSPLGVRAVSVDCGSWDHHAGAVGALSYMIDDLSRSLAAFFTDLGEDAARVTVVTVSEFGRRVAENSAYGFDHGYGNCVLVLGAGVQGGRYYGSWPGLGHGADVDGDLAVTTDFRTVLSEIVERRMPEVDTNAVFPGSGYTNTRRLGFMT